MLSAEKRTKESIVCRLIHSRKWMSSYNCSSQVNDHIREAHPGAGITEEMEAFEIQSSCEIENENQEIQVVQQAEGDSEDQPQQIQIVEMPQEGLIFEEGQVMWCCFYMYLCISVGWFCTGICGLLHLHHLSNLPAHCKLARLPHLGNQFIIPGMAYWFTDITALFEISVISIGKS